MASPAQDDNSTPEGVDSSEFAPASNPMIINGEVVDGDRVSEVVPAELVDDDADQPAERPRNGMANAGLLFGIAALVIPLSGLAVIFTAVAAIVLSMIGIRRAIAFYRESGVSVGRWPATIGLALGFAATLFSVWTFFAAPVAAAG